MCSEKLSNNLRLAIKWLVLAWQFYSEIQIFKDTTFVLVGVLTCPLDRSYYVQLRVGRLSVYFHVFVVNSIMEINPRNCEQALLPRCLVCCPAVLCCKASWLGFTAGRVSTTGCLSPKDLLAAEKWEISWISWWQGKQTKQKKREKNV